MFGEGNSAKLIGDIVNGTTQVTEGMTAGLGIDLKGLLAGFLGGKASQLGTTTIPTELVNPNPIDTDTIVPENLTE